jgi:hypothetical protein
VAAVEAQRRDDEAKRAGIAAARAFSDAAYTPVHYGLLGRAGPGLPIDVFAWIARIFRG